LRVHLMGGFEVEGVQAAALGTRKARLLLRRLALAAGRPVGVDELAEAVWGDDLPANPGDQLSVLISRMRGVLGADRLRRGDAGYWLAADWIDIVELRSRTDEIEERLRLGQLSSAFAAAQAATAIARGPLLPEDDAAWVDEARRVTERLIARARLLAAEAALAVGETASARAAAEAVLDQDPYDEAALRLVMRADATGGRPAAGLAAYAAFRMRLVEELGADPAPETEAVHTAILRGELTPVSPSPVAASMVGRLQEMRAMDDALDRARRGEAVAVVVEGDAGMGKSLLLRSWSRRIAGSTLVVSGRCDELGRDLPLQPVVEGLAAHLREVGRAAADALLADDGPVLGSVLGRGRVAPSEAAVTMVSDGETARLALFSSLTAVLGRAAGERPLVLVVDDLHRAAPGTAEFMAFVLARLPRVVVLAARRPDPGADLPEAERIRLGPLALDDAVALVGPERGPGLHERCGGHPLFLTELARSPDGELPASIVDAVRVRVAGLGAAAAVVQVAAITGPAVDVDLVATITAEPVPAVLDGLERAAQAGLLAASGPGLSFAHELVRAAVDAGASPARRVAIHRMAAHALAGRPAADPLVLAGHARLGGDNALAAAALTSAAAQAADRFERDAAEALLDEGLKLDDTVPARLARGRLRLARLDLDGARDDAARAVALGAGASGLELAGWVTYYARDYDAARRYADEGVERAGDDAVRASCLALAGRVRHTRGELADAGARLAEAVAIAPATVRGVAQVWHAQLLVHRGEPEEAAEVARRGLLDPHLGHPFAPLHGRYTLAFALALSGRWAYALDAVDDLDAATARAGDRRFPAVNANVRGWLLRGAGLVPEARQLHQQATTMGSGSSFLEPRYAALLDLAEDGFAVGALDEAATALGECDAIVDWDGSMSWRHQGRYRLLTARLASIGGDHTKAAEQALWVATAEAARGNVRYECRAGLIAATAQARAGRAIDQAAVGTLIERFVPVAGPDGWRDLAELATAARSERWWHQAEDLAARVVAQTRRRPDIDADRVAAAVRAQLDRQRW
jgi:DNA-binding SARP family transcriptional activator/tetratricopeptide (TPR) repeat protein